MKNLRKRHKIEQSLGGQTLHRVADGFKIRRKTGVDGDRIKTDPKFGNTLLSTYDFTTAAIAGRVLREALSFVIGNARDSRMTIRLTTQMRHVLKRDVQHARGQRQVQNGDLSLLHGFQFNANCPLPNLLLAPYTTTVDRETGLAQVIMDGYKPRKVINSPKNATHYVLHMAATAVDFVTGKAQTAVVETLPQPLDEHQAPGITLSAQLEANSDKPLFVVLGMHFLSIENGIRYAVGGSGFSGLAIVGVE